MAKIQQEIIVVKVSKLLRDDDAVASRIIDQAGTENLEAVVQELAGSGVLVEIEQVEGQ